MADGPSRRRILRSLGGAGAAGVVTALGGCLGDDDGGDETPEDDEDEDTPTPESPDASFAFEYDDDASEVTITHDSGDILGRWNTGTGDQCSNPGLAVNVNDSLQACWAVDIVPGTSTAVSADPGDTVELGWYPPDADATETLDSYQVPSPEATPTPEPTPDDDGYSEDPVAAFTNSYDADAGQLTVIHDGGDAFVAENTAATGNCDRPGLQIKVDGADHGCWPVEVGPGDRTAVDVSGGERVRIVWTSADGSDTRTVMAAKIPANPGTPEPTPDPDPTPTPPDDGRPDTKFDFEVRSPEQSDQVNLTITHAKGEAFTDENTGATNTCFEPALAITSNGNHRICWPTDVSPGSNVDLIVDPNDVVRVEWSSPDGDESGAVARFVVPEDPGEEEDEDEEDGGE